ncbi:MAG TPA: hypothetical protein VGN57_14230 [Pirellulaceae bacterium]|jgi:murein DD-endopeptidase MepM/ murein hydrolase activator NlpD|nr:hypothetical protein [Pirellulaceae bacterium]
MDRSTQSFRRSTFGAIAFAFGAVSPAMADEPATPSAPSAVAEAAAALSLADASLEELARQLDADSFDERQAAQEALAKRGAEAIPLLEKLATEGTRETKSRALDLLIVPAKAEGESEAKKAATEALERLAKSADAYASRRAAEALAPPPEPVEAPQIVVAPRFQGLPVGPRMAPNIRLQAVAPNGGIVVRNANLKVERRNDNGQEKIVAEEGDRKVQITKSPDGKIEMEIVEKKDGKESNEKFAAKNEADLKANEPEAYELYKKYADDGGVQAQIIVGNPLPAGFPSGIPAFAPPFPGAPAFPAPVRPANEMRLDMLKRMLENVHRQERMIQEQIDELEKEMQAKDLPAEAPEAAPEPPAEEAPAEEAPKDELPRENREAGSDANGGSDD